MKPNAIKLLKRRMGSNLKIVYHSFFGQSIFQLSSHGLEPCRPPWANDIKLFFFSVADAAPK
jgi:hypothetical protein